VEFKAFDFLVHTRHQTKPFRKVDPVGVEALAELKETHEDIVLMDLHTLQMDGFQTTARHRHEELGTGPDPLIIALTAIWTIIVQTDPRGRIKAPFGVSASGLLFARAATPRRPGPGSGMARDAPCRPTDPKPS
jgi:hypothetical protein